MVLQLDDGHGMLFKNDKGGVESRPDYKGECKINGVQLEMAAWIKQGKKGPFMSMNFQPPRQQAPEQPAVWQRAEPDEEIPF